MFNLIDVSNIFPNVYLNNNMLNDINNLNERCILHVKNNYYYLTKRIIF